MADYGSAAATENDLTMWASGRFESDLQAEDRKHRTKYPPAQVQ